jgi:hypothetical protein
MNLKPIRPNSLETKLYARYEADIEDLKETLDSKNNEIEELKLKLKNSKEELDTAKKAIYVVQDLGTDARFCYLCFKILSKECVTCQKCKRIFR